VFTCVPYNCRVNPSGRSAPGQLHRSRQGIEEPACRPGADVSLTRLHSPASLEECGHEPRFTGATTIAHGRLCDVDSIASFDDDFDGIYERIGPAEVRE